MIDLSTRAAGLGLTAIATAAAAALGFGRGTPLYYDMEAYPPAQRGSVLGFLSAWTTQLHVEGYRSAVYSSSSSGIADLAGHTTSDAMPDVIWDALWNGDASTADPVLPAGDWAVHQRAHQYSGNVNASYGGDALAIDQDYLDVSVPPLPAGPAGPALVSRAGTVADFVIRADRNLYVYDQVSPGGGFAGPKRLTTGGGLAGTPVAAADADGIVWVFARTTGGLVRVIWQSAPGGAFGRSATFSGRMAASPAAIVTQNGTVALYAVGTNGQLYTWTQARVGGPITGPTRMTANGGLTGTPVAALNGSGALSVYARTVTGAVRAKWQSAPGGPFSNNGNLGAPIAGGLAALAIDNDTIALFATGTDGRQYGAGEAAAAGAFGAWAVI